VANVTCRSCGRELPDEGPGLERLPCPSCGSTTRAFTLTASAGSVHITGSTVSFTRSLVNGLREPRSIVGSLDATLDPVTLVATATSGSPPAPELPDILLAAEVVSLGRSTPDGSLIVGVTVPWFAILRELDKDPEFLFRIHWRKLEELIAGAFDRDGWPEVVLTPPSGDKGRDVIATRPGVGSVRIIGQVKAYRAGHVVDAEEVSAVCWTRELDHASKAMVMTTSRYAPGILKDARLRPYIPHQIELLDGEQLRTWLLSLKDRR
jgi:restriction system protein